MTIRIATAADIPALLTLERNAPSAAHWTEAQYHRFFAADASKRLILLLESTPSHDLLGFLVAHHIPPEWELENIAVTANARRRGLGKQLVTALVNEGRHTNSESVFLEVRESNAAARCFYEKLGFRQMGHRSSYYHDPPEDAIVYRLILK